MSFPCNVLWRVIYTCRADSCMGGITKSNYLENSFHTEFSSSLLVLLTPTASH